MVYIFSQAFVRDYKVFKEKVRDFDRRLGTISCQAFDDCGSTESVFKVCYNLNILNLSLNPFHIRF